MSVNSFVGRICFRFSEIIDNFNGCDVVRTDL